MNIGQAAKLTALSIKQIRDYEKIGLLSNTSRTESGYRIYRAQEIARLKFIANARRVGFSLAQIQALLNLHDNPNRSRCDVKQLTAQHLAELKQKISELETMTATLQQWHDACNGDDEPNCPILNELAE